MSEESRKHVRVIDTFIGPFEKSALRYFCKVAPVWMTPDILTIIGVIGALIIAAGYILASRNLAFLWLASFGYLVNWYGDSMDGSLARYRKIERPKYGYYLDHTVDCVNEFIVILAMGISSLVHFEIAALALIGYLLLSTHTFLRTYVDDVFEISFGKLGPTEVRAIIILINTVVFFTKNPKFDVIFNQTLSLFDMLMLVVVGLLYFFYFTTIYSTIRDLAKRGV